MRIFLETLTAELMRDCAKSSMQRTLGEPCGDVCRTANLRVKGGTASGEDMEVGGVMRPSRTSSRV